MGSMRKRLGLAVVLGVLTIVFGTIYVVNQQSERLRANDAPQQLAQTVASELEGGTTPQELVTSKVNMATSLEPFAIVYAKDGRAMAGSGYLNGKLAAVPLGVLQTATKAKPHSVTWQPQNGVRVASVTVVAGGYYVLGGQSLRLVENHATTTLQLTLLGWLASVFALLGGYVFIRRIH